MKDEATLDAERNEARARFERLDALFNAALEQPEAERTAFLDEACTGDAPLRAELDKMLAALSDDSFLARPVGRVPRAVISEEEPASEVPDRVGRIQVLEHLGQGGMGRVFAGYDEKLQRPVAVKVLHHRLPKGSRRRVQLLHEAQVISQLRHPGICQVYDFIEEEEVDYLILELIEGQTLDEVIRAGVGLADALWIAEQIADALAAAHRHGVVHRDLKPGNVMVTPERGAGPVTSSGPSPGARTDGFSSPVGSEIALGSGTCALEARRPS